MRCGVQDMAPTSSQQAEDRTLNKLSSVDGPVASGETWTLRTAKIWQKVCESVRPEALLCDICDMYNYNQRLRLV